MTLEESGTANPPGKEEGVVESHRIQNPHGINYTQVAKKAMLNSTASLYGYPALELHMPLTFGSQTFQGSKELKQSRSKFLKLFSSPIMKIIWLVVARFSEEELDGTFRARKIV